MEEMTIAGRKFLFFQDYKEPKDKDKPKHEEAEFLRPVSIPVDSVTEITFFNPLRDYQHGVYRRWARITMLVGTKAVYYWTIVYSKTMNPL